MTVYSQMENALNVAAGGRDVDGRQGVYVLFDLMHKVHCGKCALNKKKEEVLKCSTCSDLRTTVDGVIFRAGMASGKSARSGCRAPLCKRLRQHMRHAEDEWLLRSCTEVWVAFLNPQDEGDTCSESDTDSDYDGAADDAHRRLADFEAFMLAEFPKQNSKGLY